METYRFERIGSNDPDMSIRNRGASSSYGSPPTHPLEMQQLSYEPQTSQDPLIDRQPAGNVPARSAGFVLDTQRKAALADVDNAPFSLFHVKVWLVAGMGFFVDAYDTFAIDLVIPMLTYVYKDRSDNFVSPERVFGLKAASAGGTILGQLVFGWLGDVYGRKRMYGIELIIIIIGTFGQILAGESYGVNIFSVIIFYRVLMGIGIGGDYPLSSIISAEFAPTRFRGKMMVGVFSSQGWGQLTASIVTIVALSAFNANDVPSLENKQKIDMCWRLVIGLGTIPAAIALFFRLTIPETPRYTMDIERNVNRAMDDVELYLKKGDFSIDPDAVVQRAEAPRASLRDFMDYFKHWSNLKVLLGTSWSWFALDIAFYGLNLNTPILLKSLFHNCPDPTTCLDDSDPNNPTITFLHNAAVVNIVLSLGGLLPGFIPTFFLIDRWGRKPIQLLGFCVLSIIFLIVGFGYNSISNVPQVFLFLYCFANFFQNFGPNSTTFIIPGELFPTRYRSTAFGISSASGKLGAIIAQICFYAAQQKQNTDDVKTVLTIFAFFMISGIFSTWFCIPETRGFSLETLSNENQEGFITGVATRVDTTEDGLIIRRRRLGFGAPRAADIGNGL